MVVDLALFSSFRWWKMLAKAMGRTSRKGDSLVAPEIPLDLQIEILTRLPAKSLMRFKCVSKLWSCLIRSRYFSNLYLTVASPPRRPRLYMSYVEHLVCDSMEVCHNPGKSLLLSLSLSSSSGNSADESLETDLSIPGMGGQNMVVLRGLILYIVCRKACIYNSATRQSVTLPAVKSDIFAQEEFVKYVWYFLGHDPVLDQYKVVCTATICSEDHERITSEHWVLVLEAGGSWKKIEFDQHHFPTRQGVCLDGVMYYLAGTCTSGDILVRFDVRSEEFNMIQAPHELSDFGEWVGFIEYGGKPTILDCTHLGITGLVDLWVLGEGGNWSKKSLVLQPRQMHLVDNININADWKVLGTTQDGQVILASNPMYSPCYILYYDLLKNDLRKITFVRETSNHGFSQLYIDIRLTDKSENIMHLET